MATNKVRSLGGARSRIGAGKHAALRIQTASRSTSTIFEKSHPNGAITQRSGSGPWQSTQTSRTIIKPHSESVTFDVEQLRRLAGSAGAGDLPEERLFVAIYRKITSVNLIEVERANGSMDAVAERMFASIPGANVLDDRVGPFYDTAGLEAWFQMSRQRLNVQVKAGDVLCVMSADGFRLYPSFQFDSRGARLPRLREVFAGLDPEHLDTWGDAVWLNAPADELGGLTPARALRTDRADEVVRLAEQAGAFRLG